MEMNWYFEFKEVVASFLRSLQFGQNKSKGKLSRDINKSNILILSYGLEGKTFSKEEISYVR